MKTHLLTAYTADYADDAMGLVTTAAEFNLDVLAVEIDQCAWQDAVRKKPAIIACALSEIPTGDGLLWIDADARIRRPLDLSVFEGRVDLACSVFRWSNGHPLEMLTGTLFVRHTEAMAAFVREWIIATGCVSRQADTPEQTSLMAMCKRHENEFAFLNLPIEWTWVEEMRRIHDWGGKRPIIEHLQRSRTARAKKP